MKAPHGGGASRLKLLKILTVEFRFRKGDEGHALLGQLFGFLCGRGAVDWPLFGIASVNIARLYGEALADVLEVLLYIVMDLNQHLFKLCGCRWSSLGRFWLFRRRRWWVLLHMDGACVRQLFDFGCPASGTGDQFLLGLLLVVLKAGKPSLETMFFTAQKIVNNHETPAGVLINKVVRPRCQEHQCKSRYSLNELRIRCRLMPRKFKGDGARARITPMAHQVELRIVRRI